MLQAESEARQAATAQLAEQRKDAAAAERQLRAYYEGRLRERNRELAAARMHVQVQSLVGRGAKEGLVWCACMGAGCCQAMRLQVHFLRELGAAEASSRCYTCVGDGHRRDASAGIICWSLALQRHGKCSVHVVVICRQAACAGA